MLQSSNSITPGVITSISYYELVNMIIEKINLAVVNIFIKSSKGPKATTPIKCILN